MLRVEAPLYGVTASARSGQGVLSVRRTKSSSKPTDDVNSKKRPPHDLNPGIARTEINLT
jgi:hypothetical protein